MVRKEYVVEEIQKLMENVEQIRNIAIVAHVDHGKTTLTDSLVARAGLINKELAGEQRVMDFEELEQKRGITIKSANISLGFHYEGKDYVINLIDTPGHVDFGGHVTRALRAVDGVVLVVDAVEGIMPQTETVLRQALKERARPVVFVNKVDRLINELKLNFEQMQERFIKIIDGINKIIESYAPDQFKEEWKISVQKGNIAFGSAYHKWAISISSMKKFNITFKDIYEKASKEEHKWLVERSPVDEVLLEMVIKFLPNPKVAQAYRIPALWHGDLESEVGRDMLTCNPKGKTVGVVFGVVHDEHAGEVGVIRLFSGTIKKGDELYVVSQKKKIKVQQVAIYMGPDRVVAERVTAGNIAAIIGLKDVTVGETVASEEIEPFEQIKHYAEPVVTKSVEPKNPNELAKLIEVLRTMSKEDPTLRVQVNQETGEILISGMGELHLEIVEYKIKNEKGLDIVTSPPIVVYRESVTKKSDIIEGKSPNKHNKFKIYVEPLPEKVVEAIDNGEIPEGRPRKKDLPALVEKLISLGMSREEAKNIWSIKNGCMFINMTKGIQYLNEAQELIIQAFEDAMEKGVLAKEKCKGIKVVLVDALLHEDNVHRGPAQIFPAIKKPIYAAILKANPVLLEPKLKLLISVPAEYMSSVISLINSKRGTLLNIDQEGESVTIHAKLPVAESFGLSNELRGATQGRAIWYSEFAGFEPLPKELFEKVVIDIRKRKGEKLEIPKPEEFME